MRVMLRRHAPTAGNLRRQYLGSTDQSLCPEGVAMAQSLQADETKRRVYVSGLARTGQTARILYPGALLLTVPGLNEMDFGAFECKSYEELKEDAAYQAWLDSGQTTQCPGGEAMEDFIRRCRAAFLEVLAGEVRRGAEELHAVLHGGTLMAVLSSLATPEKEYFSWHAPHLGGWCCHTTGNAARPLQVEQALEAPALPTI